MGRRNSNNSDAKILLYIIFAPVVLAIAIIYGVIKLIEFFVRKHKDKKNQKIKNQIDTTWKNKPSNYQTQNYQTNTNSPFPNALEGKQNYTTENHYETKQSIMTKCEQEYFEVIKKVTPIHYTVQPQVNLATIVNKTQQSKYQNELFRNIDFGIFDRDYKITALIEINDKSHEKPERIARDKKVKEICKEANIPLITFWTKYGINPEYIERRIRDVLAQQRLN